MTAAKETRMHTYIHKYTHTHTHTYIHTCIPAEDIATGDSSESDQNALGPASRTRIIVKRKEKDATSADPTAAATFGLEKKTESMKENVMIEET